MTKTILIYPPFCTPASPPYSITNIFAFLRNNLPAEHEVDVIDLNIEFHKLKLPGYQRYYKGIKQKYDAKEYDDVTKEYRRITKHTYSENNRMIIDELEPQFFDELLQKIIEKGPDTVAFSIVYSSQVFYAYALIKALKELGIETIIGGPAVNNKLEEEADLKLDNELELLNHITGEEADHRSLNCRTVLDFRIYNLDDYFTPETVIPIRTTSSCYYRRCTFCTHHDNAQYIEYPLENIKESIVRSRAKHVFIVDDMIHKKRLLDIAAFLGPLDISWMCQLRPTSEFDRATLDRLKASGLKVIMWGVESASDRILKLMQKGTTRREIEKVLKDSHEAGIKNVVYIMFGFPTESEAEFIRTIDFLRQNKESIDLVSTSIFGLQKGTVIYKNPILFGIKKITEDKRTMLEPSITFDVSHGLTTQRATDLRGNYKKTLDSLSKFPRTMNFFREHMLCLSSAPKPY